MMVIFQSLPVAPTEALSAPHEVPTAPSLAGIRSDTKFDDCVSSQPSASNVNYDTFANEDRSTDFCAHDLRSVDSDVVFGKSLRKSISTIERRITSVRSSFSVVQEIIANQTYRTRSLPGVSDHILPLRLEWENISQAFTCVIKSSRNAALQGATAIEQLITVVLPYLLEDGDFEQKKSELQAYRRGLHDGSKIALSFGADLHEISTRVMDFSTGWKALSHAIDGQFQLEIEMLQSEISGIKKSLEETQTSFRAIFSGLWCVGDPSGPNVEIKALQASSKETSYNQKLQRKSEEKVSEHASKIRENTENLVVVWNLIYNDVCAIENQVDASWNSSIPKIFECRIARLSRQYALLKASLEMLGVAMACIDAPLATKPGALFRKLFGF